MYAYTGSKLYKAEFDFSDSVEQASNASFATSHLALGNFGTSLKCAIAAARSGDIESQFWEAVRQDASTLDSKVSLELTPLWAASNPLQLHWDEALQRWLSLPFGWHFWKDWYQGVLTGHPLDWRKVSAVAGYVSGEDGTLNADESIAHGIERVVAEFSFTDFSDREASAAAILQRNRGSVEQQLRALYTFVDDEIHHLRGLNSLGADTHERVRLRINLLLTILDTVDHMIRALDGEADRCSNAMVLVDQNLNAVIEVADQIVEGGGSAEVSEIIATMSVAIKHLTDAGAPGHHATAIAFADMVLRKVNRWRKRQ